MICPKCSFYNEEDSKFCINCGSPILDSGVPTPPLNVSKKSLFNTKNIIVALAVVVIFIAVFFIIRLNSNGSLNGRQELKVLIDEKDDNQIITMVDENGKLNKLNQQFSRQTKIEDLGMVEQDGMKFVYFKATDKNWAVDYFWDEEANILYFRAEDANSYPKKISYSKNISAGAPIWKLTKGLDEFDNKNKKYYASCFTDNYSDDYMYMERKIVDSKKIIIIASNNIPSDSNKVCIYEYPDNLSEHPKLLNDFYFAGGTENLQSIAFGEISPTDGEELQLEIYESYGNMGSHTYSAVYSNPFIPSKTKKLFLQTESYLLTAEDLSFGDPNSSAPSESEEISAKVEFGGTEGGYKIFIEENNVKSKSYYNNFEKIEKKYSNIWEWSEVKGTFVETKHERINTLAK